MTNGITLNFSERSSSWEDGATDLSIGLPKSCSYSTLNRLSLAGTMQAFMPLRNSSVEEAGNSEYVHENLWEIEEIVESMRVF